MIVEKLEKELNWKPSFNLKKLVKDMVDKELINLRAK